MSRRQRSTRDKAQRSRLAREKTLRRRARTRRAATAAAAAVAMAGGGTVAVSPFAAAAPAPTQASLALCDGATTPSSSPSNLTDVDGTLYFTAYDSRGHGLWRSTGTAGGTVLLKRLASGDDEGYDEGYGYSDINMVGVDGALFFTVDGNRGAELWRSNGTRAGTALVKRFASDGYGEYDDSELSNLTGVGDQLFFTADDGTHGEELWRSDGTRAGTVLVKDILPNGDGGYYEYGPANLTAVGERLFFTADDGIHGDELWSSDGTKAGTVLVKDIHPGAYYSRSSRLTAVGDLLYFRARDGVHGRELWRSDGTGAGTFMVKNIHAGAGSSSPDELVGIGDTLFFSAEDAVHGRDLWTSDGTEAGTTLVKDLGSLGDYYGAYNLEPVGETLFFVAGDEAHGQELWSSDGTEAGTVMVRDVRPGEYDSDLVELTAAGGVLYFVARDGVHGRELWRSDGTGAGTTMVREIDPGTGGRPGSLTESGGELLFTADDGIHGEELWRSDGTAAGTVMVEDINTGGGISVSSRGDANPRTGTMRVRVEANGAGRIVVAPVGGRWIKRVVKDVSGAGENDVVLVLEPTRAGRKELRRHGELEVTARFTFTSCGGSVDSVTKRYALKLQ